MGEVAEAKTQVVDGARREADAYRGDQPRPLGGHVASRPPSGWTPSPHTCCPSTRPRTPTRSSRKSRMER